MALNSFVSRGKQDEPDDDKHLMCQAPECPARYSVQRESGHYCSRHAWSHRHDWDRITSENYQAVLERKKPKPPPTYTTSYETRSKIIASLKETMACEKQENKNWAYKLRERHDAGELLSKIQIDAYKVALRMKGL